MIIDFKRVRELSKFIFDDGVYSCNKARFAYFNKNVGKDPHVYLSLAKWYGAVKLYGRSTKVKDVYISKCLSALCGYCFKSERFCADCSVKSIFGDSCVLIKEYTIQTAYRKLCKLAKETQVKTQECTIKRGKAKRLSQG